MRRETGYEEKQIREKPNRPLRCIRVTDNEEDCPNIATALLRLFFCWAEYCFLSHECMCLLYTYPSPLGKISGLLCCGCRSPSL